MFKYLTGSSVLNKSVGADIIFNGNTTRMETVSCFKWIWFSSQKPHSYLKLWERGGMMDANILGHFNFSQTIGLKCNDSLKSY